MNKTGIQLIADERRKQMRKYDAAHDDGHEDGSLGHLAAYLITPDGSRTPLPAWAAEEGDRILGENGECVETLAVAGALIAAEIDRRLRVMGEITYAPPAKWLECADDAQRVAFVRGRVSDYRAWQDDFKDSDSGPAFDFAGDAANHYLPWCVSRIHELEAQAAQANPPGRIMTMTFTQEGDEVKVSCAFDGHIPVAEIFGMVGKGIHGLAMIAREVGVAKGMTPEQVDAAIFGEEYEAAGKDVRGMTLKEGGTQP